MDGTRLMQEPDLTTIFDTVEFRDAYRISYLANAIVVPTYDEIRRTFGIIRAEYLLILCLAHYDDLSAQDVSRLTRRPRNSISRAVHRMVADGYITRTPDPVDRRQARLAITVSGRRLHERVAGHLARRQEDVLAPLSPSERAEFDRLLQKAAVHTAGLPD